MVAPSISELTESTKSIVRKAVQEGSLSALTIRIIRERLEAQYGLEEGTLAEKQYKTPMKAAIEEAKDEKTPQATSEGAKKEKPSLKDVKTAQTSNKPEPATGKKRRRVENAKEYKSAAMILSSDAEDEGDAKPGVMRVATAPQPSTSAKKVNPREKRQKVEEKPKISRPAVAEDNDSDSAMSLFDEAPKEKKGKLAEKVSTKKPPKEKNTKNKAAEGSEKDEATIKRLKSFVAACGVRKVWVKVFEGCNKPSQQIKKLKEILAELGMEGRLSLEKAKKIKQQRELAKELEDVQSFEQSVMKRSSRSRAASTPERGANSEEGGESEEEIVKPTKRKSTALRSITAFLDDQSDED